MDVMCELLDRLIPSRSVIRRPRVADPWFDSECRAAKQATRKSEHAYSDACRRATSDVSAGQLTLWTFARIVKDVCPPGRLPVIRLSVT